MNLKFEHIDELLFRRCLTAASKAAEELRSWKDKRLQIDIKSDDSPVTIADRNSNEIMCLLGGLVNTIITENVEAIIVVHCAVEAAVSSST